MMKDLAVVIANATAVRVTDVFHFDARNRSATKSLLVASDSAALAELREALAIDEASLGERTRSSAVTC